MTTRWRVISLLVSVPVLSEQITEADPRVSTELRFLTIASRRAIRCTPMESTTESTAGSPSGTAATARETPRSSTVTASSAESTPLTAQTVPMTTSAITTTAIPRNRPMKAISLSSGVGSRTVDSSRAAILPISVSIAVAVTTARPVPWVTAVPRKTELVRSPTGRSAGSVPGALETAVDSPVSAASATRSALASTTLPSAATLSPSPRTSRSPRTTSRAGTCTTRPSRTTVARTSVIRCSAATACSARASWL